MGRRKKSGKKKGGVAINDSSGTAVQERLSKKASGSRSRLASRNKSVFVYWKSGIRADLKVILRSLTLEKASLTAETQKERLVFCHGSRRKREILDPALKGFAVAARSNN